MNKKSSAHYQREYRRRLREQGLVKKEVWVLPENSRSLSQVEKTLRQAPSSDQTQIEDTVNFDTTQWTTESLFAALQNTDLANEGIATIELIEGVDASLHIIMHQYGDLPIFLTVSGEQIIVESVLWAASEVTNIQVFNETVLRTHKYFPLSTISLDKTGPEEDYYQMFGALSSTSKISNVVFEIEVLANNVIQATEAYSEFLEFSADIAS